MKKIFEKNTYAGLVLASSLLFFSCDKLDSTDVEDELVSTEVLSATELNASDEVELISEEVTSLVEEVYAIDEISHVSKTIYNSDYFPDCVEITTVVTDTSRMKTIDFGEGCELRNGNFISGIIYLSYSKDMEAATKLMTIELEDFTFNGVAVEGGASIMRMRANENDNPQSTAEVEYRATWPDGETVAYSANRTREWIEGYGSGFWGDNVFLITGMATYQGKAGGSFTKNITRPLRREMACRFIVSGNVDITRNDASVSLDFGDGSCDSIGVLTFADGTTKEVSLRRFHKKFPPRFPF